MIIFFIIFTSHLLRAYLCKRFFPVFIYEKKKKTLHTVHKKNKFYVKFPQHEFVYDEIGCDESPGFIV